MTALYKQLLDPMTGTVSTTILRVADQAFIPDDGGNRDRAEYEAWLAEGNEPDPPAQVSVAERLPEATPDAGSAPAGLVQAVAETMERVLAPVISRLDVLEARIDAGEHGGRGGEHDHGKRRR